MVGRSVRATAQEVAATLPGDGCIPDAIGSLTHAISLRRPPADVWPWLAQMGAGTRAGWYSYDRLDNGGRPSLQHIDADLQVLEVGMTFPALPGATDAFRLLAFEAPRHLVLGATAPDGRVLATWSFVLREVATGTRLVVRARGARGYRLFGLPQAVSGRLVAAVNFVMGRKQLLELAARVEGRRSQRAARRGLVRTAARYAATGAAVAVAGWAAYAGLSWLRYGRPAPPRPDEADDLLDAVMPRYDVVDRHAIRLQAPPEEALAAACAVPLFDLPVVRAIFRARERLLGATPAPDERPRGLLEHTRALGWVVLAERPGREIVMGSATQPWRADVTFRSVSADAFAAFDEPGYVKIAWTLRADAADGGGTVLRTETRAVATDAEARRRFRVYWAWLSPGIRLIRPLVLGWIGDRGSRIADRGGREPRADSRSPARHRPHTSSSRSSRPQRHL